MKEAFVYLCALRGEEIGGRDDCSWHHHSSAARRSDITC